MMQDLVIRAKACTTNTVIPSVRKILMGAGATSPQLLVGARAVCVCVCVCVQMLYAITHMCG